MRIAGFDARARQLGDVPISTSSSLLARFDQQTRKILIN